MENVALSDSRRSRTVADTRPDVQLTQEMRFAVVMYGGTSLAIYINGVAQELLALVRATAPETTESGAKVAHIPTKELRGAEHVYRELGQMVGWDGVLPDRHGSGHPIRTRFVVDILSGTSAGGLNAIFLSKALANEQDLTPLKSLWRERADLSLLVNDDGSTRGTPLVADRPPTSLLNSKKMYWELLSALDGMEGQPEEEAVNTSHLVDELDCWITTTDIRGLLLPIDLYDRFVFERRHKKAFQFVYRPHTGPPARNDFARDVNPFLAFAGRCTAAFPFAFEPMQLADIDAIVKADRFRNAYEKLDSFSKNWRTFFEEYLKPGGADTIQDASKDPERIEAYRTSSFGDGGYLDNKPFTYATQALTRRRAKVPVDRRLIYVEPDPNDRPPIEKLVEAWRDQGPLADITGHSAERPNALANVAAALLTLPRVETIREDIERLLDRNRDLARVSDVAWSIDIAVRDGTGPAPFPEPDVWRAMSAREWMQERGVQYAAYYRLHVASVLDDLARTVTRAAGFDENSDEEAAIRCFVQAWANRQYPEGDTGAHSQNELLARFDLEYRIRRIQFVQHRIDDLLRFDRAAEARFLDFGATPEAMDLQSDWIGLVATALIEVKATLDGTLGALRAAGRALWSRDASRPNPLLPAVDAVGFDRAKLFAILDGARSKEESVRRAVEVVDDATFAAFNNVAEAIHVELDRALTNARTRVETALHRAPSETLFAGVDPIAVALNAVRQDFDLYYAYDSTIFPAAYGYLDEANRVEVIRISPEDAPSIIDELNQRRRKLAGTGVHHFGGFLDPRWRRNDMLWGRLDAAERIIETVLLGSPPELRHDLRRRAHLAIIAEEFEGTDSEELTRQLVELALTTQPGGPPPKIDQDRRDRLEAIVRRLRTPEEILAFMERPDGYEVNRQLDLDKTLETAGRAAVVTGGILDGISENARVRLVTKWIARIGRLAWGVAELASPSFPRRSGSYWLSFLLVLAVAMIVLGIALNSAGTAHVGWVFLLVLFGLAITTWVLRDIFDRRRRELAAEPRVEPRPPPPPRWRRVLSSRAAWVTAVVIVAILALAFVEVVAHLGADLKSLVD